MAPGHQQLEGCVIEKLEYTYSYMEGDPEDKDVELLSIYCLDEANQDVELKLSRSRPKVWEKVVGVIRKVRRLVMRSSWSFKKGRNSTKMPRRAMIFFSSLLTRRRSRSSKLKLWLCGESREK